MWPLVSSISLSAAFRNANKHLSHSLRNNLELRASDMRLEYSVGSHLAARPSPVPALNAATQSLLLLSLPVLLVLPPL
jgi:hypothetical protein